MPHQSALIQTMIAPTSTPFKILANLGDENDSSVMKKSFKGAKTVDFSRKGGLSSFPDTTKISGLSVTKSTRKPLVDLSKGQLNSRLSNTSIKPNNNAKGALGKPRSQSKMAFDIPIITTNKAAAVTKKLPQPEFDMVIILHQLHSFVFPLAG